MKSHQVIIIGAGIGSLALANILIIKGYQVEVYEKNNYPGGRAGWLEENGFKFDTGPSWYLMPEIFEHFYNLIGQNINNHLQLKRLSPAYRVFFEDQQVIDIFSNINKAKETFETIEPGSAKKLDEYLNISSKIYQIAKQNFLYTNFDRPLSFLNLKNLKNLRLFLKIRTKNLDQYIKDYFHDSHLIKILEYQSVFLGTSPYDLPAIYNLMNHLDFNQGVYYPKNGIYSVISSLYNLAKKNGVKFYFNQPVKKINIVSNKIKGVTLKNGQTINADIVVSNADMYYTEHSLIEESYRSYSEKYWQQKVVGPSAILIYLGIKGKLDQLQHHNLLFVNDWQKNFNEIFKLKTWPLLSSIYISKTSLTDPNVAPKGYENLFVLIPGPANQEKISQFMLNKLVDCYLDEISQFCQINDLKSRIVYQKVVGPDYFSRQFNSWQSTALGLSHILNQSAFFRPKNQSKKVQNLYYVGSSTVPGIGLPMCLISAELVYKRLINNHSNKPLRKI